MEWAALQKDSGNWLGGQGGLSALGAHSQPARPDASWSYKLVLPWVFRVYFFLSSHMFSLVMVI